MDFNFKIPHANGEIVVGVTGGNPNAAFAAVQMGHEIAAMLGAQPAGAPVDIAPESEPVPHNMTVQEVEPEPAADAEEPQLDSNGTPFDPELHTGTIKKDGTWRLKKGAAAKIDEASDDDDDEEDAGNEPAPTAAEPEAPIAATETTSTTTSDQAPPSDLPVITDAELQRYCGRLAAHFGGSDGVFALAGQFVPEGEMPRPTNIKDQAQRHAFIKQAEAETGVIYHG
jgi:hypothetical protein